MKKQPLILIILIFITLFITACKEQPRNATLFGDSQMADYLIEVDKNLTATVNLTFYYDAGEKSNWIEIRLPKQATLLTARDDYGEINTIQAHKYWFQGKVVTSTGRFFIKTHYLENSGNLTNNIKPVTIVYTYELLPGSALIIEDMTTREEDIPLLNKKIAEETTQGLFHLIYFSPLLGTATKNTFEIKFPNQFYVYSAYGFLCDPEKEISKRINMQLDQKNRVVKFEDAKIDNINIHLIGDISAPDSLNIEELDKYVIISKEENSSLWFNKTVAPHFPVLEKMTGLKQPYEKFIIVFPPDCSFEAYNKTMSTPHRYGNDGLILLNCFVWGPEIIHETTHGYLEFLSAFKDSSWFNEGSASYTQKFMERYDVKFLDYTELKNLYLGDFVFDKTWYPEMPKKQEPPINYYMYTAFIIDAYVQEYGIEALHKVYARLKEMGQACEEECYSHDDIIKAMIEVSGEPITEEDILYPYRKLFFTDKQLFLQKIEPLVRNVYCWYNEHTQTTFCDAPGDENSIR